MLLRLALLPSVILPCCVLAQAPRGFFLDSTYDRFRDEHLVMLKSRIVYGSVGPGTKNSVQLEWFARCEPNGSCGDLAARLIYGVPESASATEKRAFRALNESTVCIDYIFHTTDAEKRERGCFQRVAAGSKGDHSALMLLDQTASLTIGLFLGASLVEARPREGTEFQITAGELKKLNAFKAEFDRRCVRSGESGTVNCFLAR